MSSRRLGECHEGGDFHWYRLDNNGRWSHKPGQTGATDLDNSDRPITDPRTADTGVYKFICFLTTNRSVVINTFNSTGYQENEISCAYQPLLLFFYN